MFEIVLDGKLIFQIRTKSLHNISLTSTFWAEVVLEGGEVRFGCSVRSFPRVLCFRNEKSFFRKSFPGKEVLKVFSQKRE